MTKSELKIKSRQLILSEAWDPISSIDLGVATATFSPKFSILGPPFYFTFTKSILGVFCFHLRCIEFSFFFKKLGLFNFPVSEE